MAAPSLYRLPDELILGPVLQKFPCRERQIRSLATLLTPSAAPCRNLTVHGVEATGKTAVITSLLRNIARHVSSLRYSVVHTDQCITARHLFESIVSAVSESLDASRNRQRTRCETLAQLDVELCQFLKYETKETDFRFVLVLDALDRARDAPPTLIPAMARLSEIIPCLTVVFIMTGPRADHLRAPSSPSLLFPPYEKTELIRILSLTPPQLPVANTTSQEIVDLWPRFCAAVYDALVRSAARSLPAFRRACDTLWPRFVDPVEKGLYKPTEFSKLLVAGRTHFQDESVLNPSIVSRRPGQGPITGKAGADLPALLPRTARILLLCAYLASHNATRHDQALFSTHHALGRRNRRANGSSSKHRKIARKLLGAHVFVLERMLAIFAAVRLEWIDHPTLGKGGLDGDVGMALSTLTSLRLLHRVGTGGDVMDRGGKWRINVGWDVVRGVGRSVGVEVEEWLID
ncbi:unnamed protein product [Clonostachys byssicola]|uniref:Origin recognition complex subunit 5 n=1 Tax=Clonostachys byssicola TaxID=160290 RepID=A0A9N9XVN1_9HYPO|nr:unnamed protein product [Clonostachys byssicola]